MASITDSSKAIDKWLSTVEKACTQFDKMIGIAETLNQNYQRTADLLEKLHKQLEAASSDKSDLATKRLKNIQKQWQNMTDSVWKRFKQLGNSLIREANDIRQMGYRKQFKTMWDSLLGAFRTSWRSLRTSLSEVPFNILTSLKGLPSRIGTLLKGLPSTFKMSLRSLPSNILTIFKYTIKGMGAVWKHVFRPLFSTQKKAAGALTPLKNMTSKAFTTENLRSAMAFSDNYMNSLARISAINDGTQSDEELKAKVLSAATRSRGRYFEMTENVAKLGAAAPQAFASNDEMIAFAELSQKAFRLGGAGAAEQQAGMEQLIQAMGTGGLQGNDFKSIVSTAPMLIDAIAKFTGKSKTELMEMSAEGQVTADIIKGALFAAADEINGKFEKLPLTFGDLWNQFSTIATASLGPVIERVSAFMSSAEGQQLIDGISRAIQVAAALTGSLLDGLIAIASFVSDNWSKIEPILIAVGTVWLGVIIGQLWAMIPPLLAQAAAWLVINWPILLLVAIIGLVIYALVRLGVTAEQIVGFIVGAFAVAGAAIWNVIVGVVNSIIQFLWSFFIEPFLGIIEWFINAFNGGFDNFGDAVANLIGQIISWFLSLGKIVTKIIDAIFGTEWTEGLEKIQDNVLGWGKNNNAITISRDAPALSRIGYGEAWDTGYQAGSNLVSSARNALQGLNLDQALNFDEEKGLGDEFTVPGDNAETIDKINKVNEVGRINDTVDISSEDLKMMRELAEMNAIQNFVSLTPTVNVQTGDIRNGYDVDTIIARIEQSLTDQIASSAQGVYGLG